MTTQIVNQKHEAQPAGPPPGGREPRVGQKVLSSLSPKRVSALYVLAIIIVVFSFWAPDTFPRVDTVRQVLNSNAVIGLAALAIIIPLSARVFDLSFAYTMSLSGVTCAHLVAVRDWPVWQAVIAALLVACLVGVINAFVVVFLGVDSMIGTLATGSIIQAFITFVTNEIPITNAKLFGGFSQIGQHTLFGLTLPVWYMIVLAFALWFVMEHTPLGRKIYATGFNKESARLSGISTMKLQVGALVVSSLLAGWAGISLASVLGSGSPTAGTPYLLPAFAAAFMGATQLKPGRFNAWGTLLGVLTLGAGTTGLALANAPTWAANMFTGVVLISALAVTTVKRGSGPVNLRRLFSR